MFNFGFAQEKGATLHIHVAPQTESVFMFTHEDIVKLLEKNEYPQVPVYTPAGKTATGFLVPVNDVNCIKKVAIKNMVSKFGINRNASTSEKGRKAVEVVKYLFDKGYNFGADEFTEISFKPAQLEGVDVVLTFNGKRKVIPVQVKLDWSAGPKERGGSGNLFIQTAEINKMKQF